MSGEYPVDDLDSSRADIDIRAMKPVSGRDVSGLGVVDVGAAV
jgi:hypothetical protein